MARHPHGNLTLKLTANAFKRALERAYDNGHDAGYAAGQTGYAEGYRTGIENARKASLENAPKKIRILEYQPHKKRVVISFNEQKRGEK